MGAGQGLERVRLILPQGGPGPGHLELLGRCHHQPYSLVVGTAIGCWPVPPHLSCAPGQAVLGRVNLPGGVLEAEGRQGRVWRQLTPFPPAPAPSPAGLGDLPCPDVPSSLAPVMVPHSLELITGVFNIFHSFLVALWSLTIGSGPWLPQGGGRHS